jgi:hypothetical protein
MRKSIGSWHGTEDERKEKLDERQEKVYNRIHDKQVIAIAWHRVTPTQHT